MNDYRFHDNLCVAIVTIPAHFFYLKVIGFFDLKSELYFYIIKLILQRCISCETPCAFFFQSELGIKFFILQCVLTENNNLSNSILGGCCETLTHFYTESNNNKIYSYEWLRRL